MKTSLPPLPDRFPVDQPQGEYIHVHTPRWQMSIRWIRDVIKPQPDWDVLEIGGYGDFTGMFKSGFGVIPAYFPGDIRDPELWVDCIPESSIDLVLFMEVIEHLPDWEPDQELGFGKTGMVNALRGIHRSLKPGGYLFLTTPNSNSIFHLIHWINFAPVFCWEPHIRELSFKEAQDIVKFIGFDIVLARTEEPYTHCRDASINTRIRELKAKIGYLNASNEHRGDCTVIIARKK